jgi:hypothetical protein
MPAEVERRELVPMIIATIVAAIGAFCLWSDLRNDSLGRGDGMITSAVASRAGATVAPSEPPAHLIVPQTVVCTENLIHVDDAMESPKLAERSGSYVSSRPCWPRHPSRRCGLRLRTRCFDISRLS